MVVLGVALSPQQTVELLGILGRNPRAVETGAAFEVAAAMTAGDEHPRLTPEMEQAIGAALDNNVGGPEFNELRAAGLEVER